MAEDKFAESLHLAQMGMFNLLENDVSMFTNYSHSRNGNYRKIKIVEFQNFRNALPSLRPARGTFLILNIL